MVVGIIGATGYVGAELLRLLYGHPQVTGFSLASVSFEGEQFEQVYPHFLKKISARLTNAAEVINHSDVVFSSLPAGLSEEYAQLAAEKGIPCIDMSADFRFGDDETLYGAWYGKQYKYPHLHRHAVYGLPELNRELIKTASIIGNPGCYPTGALLALLPAIQSGVVGKGTVIIDSASGITGAGREPLQSYHFPECADSLSPYKVGMHRHYPEITRQCMLAAKKEMTIIFTPHLAPMNRGILSTVYIPLAETWVFPHEKLFPLSQQAHDNLKELHDIYSNFYRNEAFVRVLPTGTIAATNRVRHANYCDISLHLEPSGTTLIVISALDNMVKGAAGQAIQSMNIRFSFEETTALNAVPAYF
ncbi:MAG: N-acetyl-gamma-glutamyl-phosphate reductase [Treponema sp.]|jgi:N-acetyl-gamma-glutamyl-phosphate reductase|nr:N-acetyl-gamma-glutamyl-phosphate reductase [Treponema sp.]